MRVVIFGAGAVGLGLLGKVLIGGGHRVCFVEKRTRVVRQLSADQHYSVDFGGRSELLGPVAACVPGKDARGALRTADAVFTCVRMENIRDVVEVLVDAMEHHLQSRLDIIAVENIPCADAIIRDAVAEATTRPPQPGITCWHGVAECVIPEVRAESQIVPSALSYADRNGYLVLPKELETKFGHSAGIVYSADFAFDWVLKWYCHCALHAVIGFVGLHRGFAFIDQTLRDALFFRQFSTLTASTIRALGLKHGRFSRISERINAEVNSLLNPHIPDTCQRVARDPARKVRKNERLRDLERLVGGHPLVSEAIDHATHMARSA